MYIEGMLFLLQQAEANLVPWGAIIQSNHWNVLKNNQHSSHKRTMTIQTETRVILQSLTSHLNSSHVNKHGQNALFQRQEAHA